MWQGLKNIPATFHPDLIWNEGALDFFEDGRLSKKEKTMMTMTSDVIRDQFLIHKSESRWQYHEAKNLHTVELR